MIYYFFYRKSDVNGIDPVECLDWFKEERFVGDAIAEEYLEVLLAVKFGGTANDYRYKKIDVMDSDYREKLDSKLFEVFLDKTLKVIYNFIDTRDLNDYKEKKYKEVKDKFKRALDSSGVIGDLYERSLDNTKMVILVAKILSALIDSKVDIDGSKTKLYDTLSNEIKSSVDTLNEILKAGLDDLYTNEQLIADLKNAHADLMQALHDLMRTENKIANAIDKTELDEI